MPRTQIPTKGGGRGSRGGKCNRGGRNARGGRGNDLQQSKAPTSTNERANEKTLIGFKLRGGRLAARKKTGRLIEDDSLNYFLLFVLKEVTYDSELKK